MPQIALRRQFYRCVRTEREWRFIDEKDYSSGRARDGVRRSFKPAPPRGLRGTSRPFPGGDPKFFTLEHANILRNLERAKSGLRLLTENHGAGRRKAHEFLAHEHLLLQLLEHHDLREKDIFYPRPTEALTPEELEAILAKCGETIRRWRGPRPQGLA